MLNDRKYKQIVNEWFARLEKGYAQPPYTKHELKVLDEVLNNHKIKKPEAVNESSISIIDETLDVQIEESEIRKIFIPIEASLFENDDAESVTASQLQTLRGKIKSPELKERYSKYLSVFYYFAPNALGEISEILLAKLLGGSHTGASQGLEDLNVDGISISLKTTAGGKNINLGSYKNLSPKDKVLDESFITQCNTHSYNLEKGKTESIKVGYPSLSLNILDEKKHKDIAADKRFIKPEVFQSESVRDIVK